MMSGVYFRAPAEEEQEVQQKEQRQSPACTRHMANTHLRCTRPGRDTHLRHTQQHPIPQAKEAEDSSGGRGAADAGRAMGTKERRTNRGRGKEEAWKIKRGGGNVAGGHSRETDGERKRECVCVRVCVCVICTIYEVDGY